VHRCEHESVTVSYHYSLIHVRIWIMVRLREFSFAWYKTVYSRQLGALVSGHPPLASGHRRRTGGSRGRAVTNRGDPAAPYAYSV
jgi:hypothetical protein